MAWNDKENKTKPPQQVWDTRYKGRANLSKKELDKAHALQLAISNAAQLKSCYIIRNKVAPQEPAFTWRATRGALAQGFASPHFNQIYSVPFKAQGDGNKDIVSPDGRGIIDIKACISENQYRYVHDSALPAEPNDEGIIVYVKVTADYIVEGFECYCLRKHFRHAPKTDRPGMGGGWRGFHRGSEVMHHDVSKLIARWNERWPAADAGTKVVALNTGFEGLVDLRKRGSK